jgi:hypothetical protein
MIFADSSFLGSLYYPGGPYQSVAERLRTKLAGRFCYSAMVRLEFRLGSLWEASRQDGWRRFLEDERQGHARLLPVKWDELLSGMDLRIRQCGREARPDLLDGLHVLAAVQCGATHFLSFDFRTRQRRFARACGLKLLPERLPAEV